MAPEAIKSASPVGMNQEYKVIYQKSFLFLVFLQLELQSTFLFLLISRLVEKRMFGLLAVSCTV
jgi:hypothetical protein